MRKGLPQGDSVETTCLKNEIDEFLNVLQNSQTMVAGAVCSLAIVHLQCLVDTCLNDTIE